jgi:hypothetical protein
MSLACFKISGFAVLWMAVVACTDKGGMNLNPRKTTGTIPVVLDSVSGTQIGIRITAFPGCNQYTVSYKSDGQPLRASAIRDSTRNPIPVLIPGLAPKTLYQISVWGFHSGHPTDTLAKSVPLSVVTRP